jgi:hypothetical protein
MCTTRGCDEVGAPEHAAHAHPGGRERALSAERAHEHPIAHEGPRAHPFLAEFRLPLAVRLVRTALLDVAAFDAGTP